MREEEIRNRIGKPELMSANALRTYLKMKKGKESTEKVKACLADNGLTAPGTTDLTSSFSYLLEGL